MRQVVLRSRGVRALLWLPLGSVLHGSACRHSSVNARGSSLGLCTLSGASGRPALPLWGFGHTACEAVGLERGP